MKETGLKKITSVLIPDGESHILRYVVNCLAESPNVKIYVMSSNENNAMRHSKYVHEFSYYPKADSDLEWIENINKEVEKNDIDVIIPIFEVGIRKLIKHQSGILLKDRLGLLSSLQDFNIASDKGLLSAHLELNHIPCPKGTFVESRDQLKQIADLKFPILIKPTERSGGGHGIKVFNNHREIEDYFINEKFKYAFILQEYIVGYDIDCSVLCKDGYILSYTIQKGNMIGENEFAPQIGLEFLYEQKLYNVVENLMKSLRWSGVAHIDMRYDKNDGQFKVIEINPRFWMSLNASQLAGVNFPYLYVQASMGKTFEKPEYKFIKYLNLKGLVKAIKLDKTILFELKFILNNTPFKFLLKDPLPMMYKSLFKKYRD